MTAYSRAIEWQTAFLPTDYQRMELRCPIFQRVDLVEIERSVFAYVIIICGFILELCILVSSWNLENVIAK